MLVLGRGRLGSSLAAALGCPLGSAREWERALPFAPGALVFVAVPDQHVPALAAALAPGLDAGQALVHLSGALPLGALEPASRRGSLHPLQSFPAPRGKEHFAGITAAVDASDPELLAALEALAVELGATPRRVADAQRTLYHAAAVTAGNYLVALAGSATEILGEIGWSRAEALDALLPLLRGTLANLEADRLPGALIGPIRRGDADTVERQLRALRATSVRSAEVYAVLGRAALSLAVEAGLEPAAAERIERVLAP